MTRPWLSRIVLVLVGTSLGLLLAEGFVRWMFKSRVVLYPSYHTDAFYNGYHIRRLRPSTTFWHRSLDGSWKFVTNPQGFRDTREYRYPKPPSTLRVICLGDSHTEGFEARQDRTFPAVIGRLLRRDHIASEVMNAGISGFSTAEELVFLENEGIKYAPDFVVLAFSANDLDDNLKCGLFRLRGDQLVVNKKEHVPGVKILNVTNSIGVIRWLSENSYFSSMVFNQIWTFHKAALLKRAVADVATEYAIRAPNPDEAVFKYQCELTSLLVRRMHEFCQRNGIKLIILEIPGFLNDSEFFPSVPEALLASLRENSDALLLSADVLRDYRGVADVFVPHGQRHISETTHLLLGMATAKKIEELARRPGH